MLTIPISNEETWGVYFSRAVPATPRFPRTPDKPKLFTRASLFADGDAEDLRSGGEGQPGVGGAEPVDPPGHESGSLDRRGGVAPAVAAARQGRIDRGVEHLLDPAPAGRGRLDVLEEPQLPAGLEDTEHLGQRALRIADAAQDQRRDGRVAPTVRDWERLGRPVDDRDRDGRL